FIGKELLYVTSLDALGAPLVFTALAVLSNIILVSVAALVFIRPFTGRLTDTPKKPHPVPLGMWLGPVVLGIGSLAAGLMAAPVGTNVIAPAVSAIVGEAVEVHLALWHGINTMLILSVITVLSGIVRCRYSGLCQRRAERMA